MHTLFAAAMMIILQAGSEKDAATLMEKVVWQRAAQHETAEFEMSLIDTTGKIRTRRGSLFSRRIEEGRQELSKLIRFQYPPELARSAVLTEEGAEGVDDVQWVYIPSAYSSRRIASKGRRERYMGTDFSYEDIMSLRIPEYRFAFLGKDSLEGLFCRLVEQVPIAPKLKAESGYGRMVHWVDPVKAVIRKTEYFDTEGRKCKVFRARSLGTFGPYFRFEEVEMEDIRSRHRTVIRYRNRDFGSPVPKSLFSIRSMERGG